jgi:hypothetical protein
MRSRARHVSAVHHGVTNRSGDFRSLSAHTLPVMARADSVTDFIAIATVFS